MDVDEALSPKRDAADEIRQVFSQSLRKISSQQSSI